MTDCGKDFSHGPHLYTTERGKVKACDGVKRTDKTGSRENK